MIYSGVDLIRTSQQLAARSEKVTGPREPTAPGQAGQDDAKGALLRFARFVNKEKRKKPRHPSKHPYLQFGQDQDRGQLLDLYA